MPGQHSASFVRAPGDLVGDGPAEAAVAGGVLDDCLPQITTVDVGPQLVGEHHFGIRVLPEQEVGESLFARRSPEQVDVGDLGLVEVGAEGLLRDVVGVDPALGGLTGDLTRGVDDLGASPVVCLLYTSPSPRD